MNNIKPYNKDNFAFHTDNISKHKKALKNHNLGKIDQIDIKIAFLNYEINMHHNTLNAISNQQSLIPDDKREQYTNILFTNSNTDTNNLFYKMKQFIRDEYNQTVDLCPYCNHDRAHTLDHIIPKKGNTGYAEFCDLPINLIPMCDSCNQYKGDDWIDNNKKLLFVNLYIDKIPDVKFLRASAEMKDNFPKITFEFFADNINDPDLATRLNNTYSKLKIFDLCYNTVAAKSELVQLQKIIKKEKDKKISKEKIREQLLETIDDNNNNYREIIQKAYVNNLEVFDYLYNYN